MPRYNLGFYKKDNAIIIDLTKIRKIESLEDLDNFTSMFENEYELKAYLVKKGISNPELLSKNINVIYKNGGVYKKIPVLYSENKKYVDEEYLKNSFLSMTSDLEFLEKLANRMDARIQHNIQGTNTATIRLHLMKVKNGGDPLDTYDMLYSALTDMFYKTITTSPDKKTGEVKTSYRGLRDLGLYLSKYLSSKKEKSDVNKLTETNEMDQISLGQSINEPKVEDDLDFVYPFDNQLYTQDGSPFFPPNSEEERKYKMQLEQELEKEMNIEEHPHYRR